MEAKIIGGKFIRIGERRPTLPPSSNRARASATQQRQCTNQSNRNNCHGSQRQKMHYNAARDVNAISIAAVREFMAVQDRIRPALNCFSQEQHATNTDHRRRRRRVDLSRTSPPHPPRSLTICPRRKIANFSPRKIFQEQSIFRVQYKYNNKNINNINFVCNFRFLLEKFSSISIIE